MGGVLIAPYGKAFDHYFPVYDRTGADIVIPTWEANDSKLSRETAVGTWSALANTALAVAHPQLVNINKVAFTAADMQCRRLIHKLQDVTVSKAWNDDVWEIQTKGHHLAMHPPELLIHAGAIQAVGSQTMTLESPGPSDVPLGSLVYVTHAGALTPKVRSAASYDSATRILTLDKGWGTNPTLPGDYLVYGAPEIPAAVPADIVSVLGDGGAAIGLKWSGKGSVPTSIVVGVNTVNQFTTALTQAFADFYVPRTFIFFGGALDLYFGFVDDYAQIAGPKGLITPKRALPVAPSVGDTVVLF
jgi:hypothetical protein